MRLHTCCPHIHDTKGGTRVLTGSWTSRLCASCLGRHLAGLTIQVLDSMGSTWNMPGAAT